MTNNNNNISNMSTPNKKNSKTKNEENCSTGGPLVTYETSGEGKFSISRIFFDIFTCLAIVKILRKIVLSTTS